MYKETVARKKMPTIFIIGLYLATYVVISDVVKNVSMGNVLIGEYLKIALTLLVLVIIIKQVNKCSIRYKYSIIADELIIYKLKGSREEVIESIKLGDIQCVEKTNLLKYNLDRFFCKKCACINLINDVYKCKYSNNKNSGKFYFEPSYKLINKLNIFNNNIKH